MIALKLSIPICIKNTAPYFLVIIFSLSFAFKVGYKDKTAIAKVEAGKVDLPQSKIYAFAKALGTTISYLFSEDNVEEHQTLSAHFDNGEYTVAELDEINQFANFVKSKRN